MIDMELFVSLKAKFLNLKLVSDLDSQFRIRKLENLKAISCVLKQTDYFEVKISISTVFSQT